MSKGFKVICKISFCVSSTLFTVSQASDNAKEAEDNARKAKSAVKTVLSTITALLNQLGKNSATSSETHLAPATVCMN